MKKIIILILLILAGSGYAWYKMTKEPELSFITIKPSRGDIVETVMATGSLVGLNDVDVGAQVNGQIEKLYVSLGDKVKKGDPIADIDQKTQLNDVKTAEAELQIAKASLKEKQALLKQQEAEYKRQVRMKKDNATSDADLEAAEANLTVTEAEIKSCEAEIEKAKVSVSTAETNLGYTKIVAPMDGVVIGVVTEEGQTVVSNQSAPTIVKIADLETMTVEAEISEADVVKIKPGLPSYFTILGLPDRKFTATLRKIEPATDSESESSSSSSSSSSTSTDEAIYYNALLDVPNPDGILRVSMTAEATIVIGESKNVLTLPIAALQNKEGENKYSVRVLVPGNKVEKRIVTVGRKDNINYEIKDGLKDGEEVIIGNDASTAEAEVMAEQESRHHGGPHM